MSFCWIPWVAKHPSSWLQRCGSHLDGCLDNAVFFHRKQKRKNNGEERRNGEFSTWSETKWCLENPRHSHPRTCIWGHQSTWRPGSGKWFLRWILTVHATSSLEETPQEDSKSSVSVSYKPSTSNLCYQTKLKKNATNQRHRFSPPVGKRKRRFPLKASNRLSQAQELANGPRPHSEACLDGETVRGWSGYLDGWELRMKQKKIQKKSKTKICCFEKTSQLENSSLYYSTQICFCIHLVEKKSSQALVAFVHVRCKTKFFRLLSPPGEWCWHMSGRLSLPRQVEYEGAHFKITVATCHGTTITDIVS